MGPVDGIDGAISTREAEVLSALGEHLTNAEIAAKLFISIRTVESHVSSLLRKLGADDRRALAALTGRGRLTRSSGRWPSPLTTFVGRVGERAELAEALSTERLVTAVGPGGVGKTRLALAAADDVRERFADGAWYVDLVPVSSTAMIAPTVAAALGMGEQQGRPAEESVLAWLADRQALVALDNCEHVVDGVSVLVERMLTQAPGLTVLATSRSRLLLPFERIFAVPGLSRDDGVELFEARAAGAGAALTADDRAQVHRICRDLEGVPLAVELAAARLPAVGLDGLEAGLSDRLALLTGARRADERHHSLRSTLDWSYQLLDEALRAVVRRVAVFARPFRVDAATSVAAWGPVAPRDVGPGLATLADHSLLTLTPGGDGTRYGALETIRQYGVELLDAAGELGECRMRHLRWSRDEAGELLARSDIDDAAWRATFDQLADELRAALEWSATHPEHTTDAHEVAVVLAALCHRRGMPAEAQQRSEQAAELAATDRDAATALRRAAGSARARLAGSDAVRLHRAAAAAALRAGEPIVAACELAHAAELVGRSSGIIDDPLPADAADSWLADAARLAGDHAVARAWISTARAFMHRDDSDTVASVEDVLRTARRAGEPLLESAALDRATTYHLARGDARVALANAMRRTEILTTAPPDAGQGFELSDAYGMATDCAVATGELRVAHNAAERARELPFHREVGYVPASRLVLVTALSGDWHDAVALASFFHESWERAGSPRVPSLRRGAQAAAMVHGCRGDHDARDGWLAVAGALSPVVARPTDRRMTERVFESMRLLHLGQADAARSCLDTHPEEFQGWFEVVWRPWYTALWVESGVLAGHGDTAERVRTARPFVADNMVAVALVDRAEALAAGDRAGALAAAAALDAAGCRYQWARSLVLIGGSDRDRGEAALTSMGAITA